MYAALFSQFIPEGHSTLLVRCSELDQQAPTGKKYDVLVHLITTEGRLECSVEEQQTQTI